MEGNFVKKIVNNNGIEIEYYVINKANDKSTLIISMGIWEPATRAFSLISRLGSLCKSPSNLTDEDIEKYESSVKELEIINFNDSGHMILDEELGKAARHINQILKKSNKLSCSTYITT
jgi:hypothetical protein